MSRAGPVGRNRSWTTDRYIAACRPWSVILFRWVCGMRVMRLKPVCRPSAATIPTSGSTPFRRRPKPPELPQCFARSTGFRSVGRPRTDRTPVTPSTGLGTFGRLRATEGGIRCDSQRYGPVLPTFFGTVREREMSVEGPMDPIITVCRVGIAERSVCSSAARGAMIRASSARRKGRW